MSFALRTNARLELQSIQSVGMKLEIVRDESRTKIRRAPEKGEVEFIDENDGRAEVRLMKRPEK